MSYKQNHKASWGKTEKKKLFVALGHANIYYLQHRKHDPYKKQNYQGKLYPNWEFLLFKTAAQN